MSRPRTIAALVLTAVVVAWGCSRAPSPAPANAAAPTKALEAKVSKLEQDLRAAEAAAAQAKERWQQEAARGQAAERERDDLRVGLKARAAERDALQTRLDGIQRLLREALGQMDTAAAPVPAVELPSPKGL
jgi:chromosome segregation ATPase